jgi:hypothetical protein
LGQWVHRLSNIDPDAMEADCANCGHVRVYRHGIKRLVWKCYLAGHDPSKPLPTKRPGRGRPRTNLRLVKEDRCSLCGFVPVDPCQLDVDHIDGNHDNNDPSNFRTLCANCHRLETKLKQQGIYGEKGRWTRRAQ